MADQKPAFGLSDYEREIVKRLLNDASVRTIYHVAYHSFAARIKSFVTKHGKNEIESEIEKWVEEKGLDREILQRIAKIFAG